MIWGVGRCKSQEKEEIDLGIVELSLTSQNKAVDINQFYCLDNDKSNKAQKDVIDFMPITQRLFIWFLSHLSNGNENSDNFWGGPMLVDFHRTLFNQIQMVCAPCLTKSVAHMD